jgi:hypothetical protein
VLLLLLFFGDELTKNRMEMDRENISGHMPEDREMPEYCPVRNFETYLQKLHPQCVPNTT